MAFDDVIESKTAHIYGESRSPPKACPLDSDVRCAVIVLYITVAMVKLGDAVNSLKHP